MVSKGTIVAIGAGTVLTGVTGAILASKISKSHKKKSGKRKSRNKSRKKKVNHNRKRYTPHTAGKGKDRSTKRIRYTKNGQPYVLKANGQAKFISFKSAKLSYKRKRGKY